MQTCVGGAWSATCANETPRSTEVCDGVDNDCDGVTDNGFRVGDLCIGRGECASPFGVLECDPNDRSQTRCSTGPGGSDDQSRTELCNNGVDEDCDGTADEGIGTLGLPGSPCALPGICGDGLVRCNGVFGTVC
ncbi:hypothetical protein HYV58_00420, partial [Candidatus Peregrinibacteria bacterium]|nr:hypothetical protein [Candidatus Peregrinibacteria bacterium]